MGWLVLVDDNADVNSIFDLLASSKLICSLPFIHLPEDLILIYLQPVQNILFLLH